MLLILSKKLQISLLVPIYYEHYDLLYDAFGHKGEFSNLNNNIITAVNKGIKK
jgi:hypothetical protein